MIGDVQPTMTTPRTTPPPNTRPSGARRHPVARLLTAATLAGAAILGTAVPALAHCGPAHGTHDEPTEPVSVPTAPIPHPTGPDDVVIRIETDRNGWGGEYEDGHDVTVYGDGRVVIVPPSDADGPEVPEATVLQVGEGGVQKILRAARRAGLLKATDYGEAGVTDQGSVTLEVTTSGEPRVTSVYALLLPQGDDGLPHKQQVLRQRLRTFVHRASNPAFYGTVATT